MKNWSAPAVILSGRRPARPATNHQGEPEEKQVDYSHLDIVAEVERIIGRSLKRHTRTTGKYHCQCPFPDCTSKNDAFTVWDRPILEERGSGRREVHFWCGRCKRTGSLISLIRQYREATTGEQMSWSDAARELRIDPRTWRAVDAESGQREAEPSRKASLRRQQAEQARQAAQAEIDMLSAWYRRARQWLAAGHIPMRDGRQIPLDLARAYLQERGFSLEQAAALGMAYLPTGKEAPEIAEEQTLAPWRGRILFPLSGPDGAGGYAGRSLWKWEPGMTAAQQKKLLEVDGKNRVPRHYKTRQQAFYGYEDACRASTLVAVEGEFDAASVRLALAGVPDIAVVAFGKNFSPRLIPANVLHVILALDIDIPGSEAQHHFDELESRGLEVDIALPPDGKDWNDCHVLLGLEAISEEIMRVYRYRELAPASAPAICDQAEARRLTASERRRKEQEQAHQAAQAEQGANLESEPIEQSAFSAARNRCPKHGKPIVQSDEMGGRYCRDVDCWARYRLIRAGAALGYPALVEVNTNSTHLADTSKPPLRFIEVPGKQERLPVYPNRPPVETTLITAGADAWRAYTSEQQYQDIDRAIRALPRESLIVSQNRAFS